MIKQNIKEIGKTGLAIAGTLFSLLSVILSFISWDEMGIKLSSIKISIFLVIVVVSFAGAILYICCLKRSATVWEKGTGKVVLRYGDIMKLAFPKHNSNKRFIVIPVNTSFDTILDEQSTNGHYPLVSVNTIHGKWLESMVKNGISIEQLDKEIDNRLQNIKPVKLMDRKQRSRGKLKFYKNGTLVPINGKQNVTYLLLAFSEFDEKNRAHACKEDVIECLKSVLEYYNDQGQGNELYIGLIGTGLSRADFSHRQSLETIQTVFRLYNEKIHGSVNIVIYKGDRSKVSIFE
ncbi:DUF6430 domain-containing protein [Blautia schinkii]|nr:DUF6430 domain-containing protein [Blautia schinkii]